MALTIEGATLGYDANNIQALLNDMNTEVIQKTKTTMRNALDGLRNDVDAVWVGASAEKFKSNMEIDVGVIARGLDQAFENLKAELNQIVSAMDKIDQSLVQGRGQ